MGGVVFTVKDKLGKGLVEDDFAVRVNNMKHLHGFIAIADGLSKNYILNLFAKVCFECGNSNAEGAGRLNRSEFNIGTLVKCAERSGGIGFKVFGGRSLLCTPR